ncbi:hypothetical protein [Marinimicrobium alkaliphilum]|uniref:hypothetical protein n=1 Tax=Marinimicrobium alkaliphilum TaxID=2202654 RepID=UPI000DBAC295|nr:hypothetical protein [Marinimicrobium alkaliphilum]
MAALRSQHRYWALPLALALAVSWCLVYCLAPVQAAPATTEVVIDCHGTPVTLQVEADTQQHHAPSDCPECDQPALEVTSQFQNLSAATLSSWHGDFPLAATSALETGLIPPPIPPPKHRLHLLNQRFLI